jgi:PEP-CTERM motif
VSSAARVRPASAGSAAPGGPAGFTWTDTFQLSSDQNANSGLPPSLNPVPPGSCGGPVGWACSAQHAGFTPGDVAPMDRLDVVTLTWTDVSGPTIAGTANGVPLGRFGADSIHDTVGSTLGPLAPTANPVPEPSSLALAGAGLLALLGLRRQGRTAAR